LKLGLRRIELELEDDDENSVALGFEKRAKLAIMIGPAKERRRSHNADAIDQRNRKSPQLA